MSTETLTTAHTRRNESVEYKETKLSNKKNKENSEWGLRLPMKTNNYKEKAMRTWTALEKGL